MDGWISKLSLTKKLMVISDVSFGLDFVFKRGKIEHKILGLGE